MILLFRLCFLETMDQHDVGPQSSLDFIVEVEENRTSMMLTYGVGFP